MAELKPCPFCGGRAQISKHTVNDGQCHFQSGVVHCITCGCRTSEYIIDGYLGVENTIDDAVKAWNRRVDNDLALSNA